MADALSVPTRTIRGGARVDDPIVARGPVLPFPGGARSTLHVPFAEPVMVHASTKVPDVAMYMAPRPALLRLAFLALPTFLLGTRLFGAFMRIYFRILRRVVLRSVASAVELVVRARSPEEERVITVRAGDGMDAGGVAIAATALALAETRPKGTLLVDEVVPFARMIERMRALDPSLDLVVR